MGEFEVATSGEIWVAISDLDLLVDTTPQTSLLDIARIKNGLQAVLGVPVDVLTPKALPEKFRALVLAESQPV